MNYLYIANNIHILFISSMYYEDIYDNTRKRYNRSTYEIIAIIVAIMILFIPVVILTNTGTVWPLIAELIVLIMLSFQ
jgi:hypothetical protein